MITIVGNDIRRGSEKIGWIQENDLYDGEGRKVGYFSSNDIYDAHGKKLGYLQGNYVHASDGNQIKLDAIRRDIRGGSLSDLERAAVRRLLGN